MNLLIISMHFSSLMTTTSTPCERKNSSRPLMFRLSAITTLFTWKNNMAPAHIGHGDSVVYSVAFLNAASGKWAASSNAAVSP